jgi:GT2 family glycosyltransferase/glycosyltransferase involved in cell wall biosynthesis
MRVLVVVHGFPPAAQGGAEIYAHAHAVALRRLFGDDVLVLTRDQDPGRPEYELRTEERDGLRVARINNTFRATRSFEDTYRHDAIGALAERVIDEFRPDVAHIHHLTCLSTRIVRSLSRRGVPCVFTLHDYWLLCHRGQFLDTELRVCDGPEASGVRHVAECHSCVGAAGGAGAAGFAGAALLRAFEGRVSPGLAVPVRRLATRAGQLAYSDVKADEQAGRRLTHMREVCTDVTHFLAPSRHMRDRFIRFGIEPDRISLSHYGFNHRPFEGTGRLPREARHRGKPVRLGFLGSLMVSKAPHLVLEAMTRLPQGAVSLDLYGAPTPYHGDDSYRTLIESLLHHEGVRLHGPVAHDRVSEALASIDALVVPSIWPENSPLVIQEAFLAGRPVVASRIGGIPEFVTHGINGLLFQPDDVDDLARALMRLVEEPGLLQTLRAGIPPVRTIEEDVCAIRGIYESFVIHRAPRSAPSLPLSPSDVTCKRTTAVVLNFRAVDQTMIAVTSLLASRSDCDIIVVDNDEDAATTGLRNQLSALPISVTYLATGRNLGFSGGMNAGIREALKRGADRVLLVNSDVVVPPDAIARLARGLDANAHAGIAGPIVLSRSEPDRIASLGMSYAPSTGRMRHSGTGDRLRVPLTDRTVDGVSGCFMLIKREVFESTGLLDEDYFFSFEDLAFCLRAGRAGFVTVLVGAASVYHEGGQSIGAASTARLYFAARNHLLMARRLSQTSRRVEKIARTLSIVALNLAHAIRARGGSTRARLGAVLRGTRDYAAGRFGSGERN